jgi:hypothetical protein
MNDFNLNSNTPEQQTCGKIIIITITMNPRGKI